MKRFHLLLFLDVDFFPALWQPVSRIAAFPDEVFLAFFYEKVSGKRCRGISPSLRLDVVGDVFRLTRPTP
jgi:hypothetical protein